MTKEINHEELRQLGKENEDFRRQLSNNSFLKEQDDQIVDFITENANQFYPHEKKPECMKKDTNRHRR